MKHEKRPMEFRIYKAKDGWRWHLYASNGRLVAESGESYKQKISMKRSIQSLVDSIQCGRFTVEEEG